MQVIGDTAVEANETFSVTLSNADGATIADGTGDRHHHQRRRRAAADPLPIGDATVTEGNSGAHRTSTFTVTLSARATAPGRP